MKKHKTIYKIYVTKHGNTLKSHKDFLEQLKLKRHVDEVDAANECNVILAFCPIVSRAGTDIQAALGDLKVHHGSGRKPIIVVGLYHTFDKEHVVPASSNYDESTFIVNCLFYEDSGILNCDQNTEAINQTSKKLKALKKKNKSLNESKTQIKKKGFKGSREKESNTTEESTDKVEEVNPNTANTRGAPKQQRRKKNQNVFNLIMLS